jgi:GT2 family glycosyltransferase
MALIAMAVHDTEENGRSKYTHKTLNTIYETVDLDCNRLIIVDNNSCKETKHIISEFLTCTNTNVDVIELDENIGTAKAINKAWALRKPKEHLIKIDNDVDILSVGWVDELEQAVERDPLIGLLGLKRKDLLESPSRHDEFKSSLRMLPHQNGQPWIIVEDVSGVMGTCVLHNYRLIDKIGGLMQPGLYGFDDTIMSVRSKLAGFKNCFLPHIEIDHLDEGGNNYTQWKRDEASYRMKEFNEMKNGLINGSIKNYISL